MNRIESDERERVFFFIDFPRIISMLKASVAFA